jgi:hypothetical protein
MWIIMDYITNQNVLKKTKGDALSIAFFYIFLCINMDIELFEFTISALNSEDLHPSISSLTESFDRYIPRKLLFFALVRIASPSFIRR